MKTAGIIRVFEEIGRAVKSSDYFEGINIKWSFHEISPNNISPVTLVLLERNLKVDNPHCNEAEQLIDLVLLTSSPNVRDSQVKLALYREQMILLMNSLCLNNATMDLVVAGKISLYEFSKEKYQNQNKNTILSHVVGLTYNVKYDIGGTVV